MMMADKPLQELIEEEITASDLQLPMFNPVAVKLQRALSDDEISVNGIEALIMEDPALASQILRVANSPFYKGLVEIKTINRAIVRLGGQQVANIAMMIAQKNSYSCENPDLTSYFDALWQHAIISAEGCRWLAQSSGLAAEGGVAFLAGLLHDIGKLIILKVLEKLYHCADGNRRFSAAAIAEILDSELHTEFGYQLLKEWNLPGPYCDVARYHHATHDEGANPMLAVVKLVDQACTKLGYGTTQNPDISLAACPEAQILSLDEIELAEFEIFLEDRAESLIFV